MATLKATDIWRSNEKTVSILGGTATTDSWLESIWLALKVALVFAVPMMLFMALPLSFLVWGFVSVLIDMGVPLAVTWLHSYLLAVLFCALSAGK